MLRQDKLVRVALAGLGKMGISHFSIVNAHPDVELVAVCDTSRYLLSVLEKGTGVACFSEYDKMLDRLELDAVVIATPSRAHGQMIKAALERGLHVFCEKPFCLDLGLGEQLVKLAEERGVVTQVGYHCRFVAAFQEMKRLIDCGVIGAIHHIRAEAYGAVVLRPKGATWRAKKSEGGGCLYDYACHAIDLMNYMVGPPALVRGTVLNKIFSRDVEDEVYASLFYGGGNSGQLAANWSDESYRKMSTKVTVWGTNGRIVSDRQECQVYLRSKVAEAPDLAAGWTVRYTTDLTPPVWFYLRGEEYSAQIDHFIQCIKEGRKDNLSSFASALQADSVVDMMLKDVAGKTREVREGHQSNSRWHKLLVALFGSR